MSDNIEFVVSLRGGSEAAGEVGKVTQAVHQAGGATRALGADSRSAVGGTSALSGGIKRLATAFIALGAGYKVYNAAKGAISYTKDLAESSKALTNATGLNISESSRYVGVAGAMGVTSQQLNTSFKSLATQTEKQAEKTHHATDTSAKHRLAVINQEMAVGALERRLAKGTITQAEYRLGLEKIKLQNAKLPTELRESKTAFDKLGISQEWVAKHGKNFNDVIFMVTKRLSEMKGSPEKTKIETELFGRSWAALNPLLGEGSEHLEKVLSLSKKFGVELKGGINKELDQLREAQLESTLASDGLRIAFTKTAAGPMINLLKGFAQLKLAAGKGEWGKFNQGLSKAMDVAGHVIETFELRSIEGFGQIAPKMLTALWHGFQNASLGNKLLMAGIIASKFGLTGSAFSAIGGHLAGSVSKGLMKGGALRAAGATAGMLFGTALVGVAVGYIGTHFAKELLDKVHFGFDPSKILSGGNPFSVSMEDGGASSYQRSVMEPQNAKVEREGFAHYLKHPFKEAKNQQAGTLLGRPGSLERKYGYLRRGHGAFGGNVRRGGLMEVGERGPEILDLPAGASITPLAPGSMADDRPIYVMLDSKVLARAMRRQQLLSQAAGA